MKYFQDRNSGRVYGSDNFGKNMLEIVNGERCVIPVCEMPAGVARLDCADEEVWKLVEAAARAAYFFGGVCKYLSPEVGAFVTQAGMIALGWLLLYRLYRKDIFLRV